MDERPPRTTSLFSGFKFDPEQSGIVKTVTMKEIVDMGMSKGDIYRAFTQKGQLYLPPIQMCNLAYFKGLLTGEKLAFTTSQITLAQVPHYKELSVKQILNTALAHP